MKVVKITHELKLIASVIGAMRSLVARTAGVRDAKIGPQSGIDGDQDGILGELAFCQLMNVWPDFGLSPRYGSADAVVSGKRIDVKTTRVKTGRLLATVKGNPDVDIYVLAIIDGDEVKFPGYAMASDLFSPERIKNLGHGEGYAMEQHALRAWK